jgi:signal transduction histidine kinase
VEQGGKAPNRVNAAAGRGLPSSRAVQRDARLLASGLRHDLRHAAATIRALVAVLQTRSEGADVDGSLAGIDDCARAITQMLELPRREPGPRAVRVDYIAEAVVARARVVFACDISVAVTECWGLVTEVDFERLLGNLVDNACRAAGPTGRVAVQADNESDVIILVVSDSGSGFGAFPPHGGIGLSVVETVTRSFGGRVTFARSQLGGVRITVELPSAGQSGPTPTTPSEDVIGESEQEVGT